MSLSSLKIRTLTGIVFIAVMISAILIHPYVLTVLFGLIAFSSALEFIKLCNNKSTFSISQELTGLMSALVFVLICSIGYNVLPEQYLWLLLLVLPIQMCVEMYRKTENSLSNVVGGFFAVAYSTVPFALLSNIRLETVGGVSGAYFILSYFVLIWIHDSGAYLVGSTFGKRRLFERISPKKSWEGLFGGLTFSLLASYFINDYFQFMPMLNWLILILMVIITANLGDLAESMLKRSVGVKDSGNILPGHGGLLDRFDAVLYSAPFVFIYLQLI